MLCHNKHDFSQTDGEFTGRVMSQLNRGRIWHQSVPGVTKRSQNAGGSLHVQRYKHGYNNKETNIKPQSFFGEFWASVSNCCNWERVSPNMTPWSRRRFRDWKAFRLGLTNALNWLKTLFLLVPRMLQHCNARYLPAVDPCALTLCFTQCGHRACAVCETSTNSSRDFSQLSGNITGRDIKKIYHSVTFHLIQMTIDWRCFHTDYIIIMNTCLHESASFIPQPGLCVQYVCVRWWTVQTHEFVHVHECTRPHACVRAATCHSRCCPKPQQCDVLSADLQ